MTPPPAPAPGADPAVLAAFDALAGRLARPESWCQGEFARTKSGISISAESPQACQWCLLGALQAVAQTREINTVLTWLKHQVNGDIGFWNDAPGRHHREVLALIAEARAAYVAGGAS